MDKLSNTEPANLAGVYKGQQLMFPLKFYSSEFTAQQIIEEYDDGSTVRELVRKFGYSESRIRQILRETKCQRTK